MFFTHLFIVSIFGAVAGLIIYIIAASSPGSSPSGGANDDGDPIDPPPSSDDDPEGDLPTGGGGSGKYNFEYIDNTEAISRKFLTEEEGDDEELEPSW